MKKTVSDEKRFIAIATVILVVISMVALFPMILLVVASFTDENELITNGYQILPKKLSLEAYTYMVKQAATIVRAYLVTIGTTVVGTGLSVLLTTSIAYPMARKTFKYRNALSFLYILPCCLMEDWCHSISCGQHFSTLKIRMLH